MNCFIVNDVPQDTALKNVIWIYSDSGLYDDNALKTLEKDIKSIYPKLTITCQPITSVEKLGPCDEVVLFYFVGNSEYNGPMKKAIEQIRKVHPKNSVNLIALKSNGWNPLKRLTIVNEDVASMKIFTIYTGTGKMELVFEKPKNDSEESFKKVVDNFKSIREYLKEIHKR